MVTLVDTPIDPAVVYSSLRSTVSGSVLCHYAIVKKKNGTDSITTSIEYLAQEGAHAELEEIARELERRWQLEDVLMIRRTGTLDVGEIISLVAASSPNSEDVFEACRFGIARMKKMTTIRKTEKYSGV